MILFVHCKAYQSTVKMSREFISKLVEPEILLGKVKRNYSGGAHFLRLQ